MLHQLYLLKPRKRGWPLPSTGWTRTHLLPWLLGSISQMQCSLCHFNSLKTIQTKKIFTSSEVVSLREKYPNVDTALCHCQKRHTKGCGCISEHFLVVVRKNFLDHWLMLELTLIDLQNACENWPIMPGMSTHGKVGSVTSIPWHCAHVDSVMKVIWSAKGEHIEHKMLLAVTTIAWPTRLNARKELNKLQKSFTLSLVDGIQKKWGLTHFDTLQAKALALQTPSLPGIHKSWPFTKQHKLHK